MIKPLGKNILLKKEKEEQKTSTLIIPGQEHKEKLIISSIGKDANLKVGNEVITNGRGQIIDYNGDKFLIVNEDDIIAIIE
jgi:co-chaperonin GroES (HSP10)